MRFADRVARVALVACTTGCSGVQSSLSPAAGEAERMAALFWWMAAGAAIVWVAVIALAIYCARLSGRRNSRRLYRILIVGGGAVVPTIVLTILLVYGLAMLPPLVARAPEGSLQVLVLGEQWWWRVRYLGPDGGQSIELANEIRLPVGEPVQFRLTSDNVIHSFWVPSLAGKMDMIPGRVTHLAMHPTRTGVFRGACAEYCGTSHASMALYVEVMEKADFARWLERQARPAEHTDDARARRGGELFLANGCSACHTVRGTAAQGAIGPDLTHVGSRLSLAAGVLPNDPEAFQRWMARTERIKPGVHMPQFGMLPSGDIAALAAYLESLQ